MIDRISPNQNTSQLRNITTGYIGNEEKEQSVIQTKKESDQLGNFGVPKEKINEVVESINKFLHASNTSLKFEYHEKLDEYFVKVIDENSKEVIREIPSKKMLDFYASMKDYIGLLVDKKI